MATTWIVSANAGRARFFSRANLNAPLEEVDDMINDAARLPSAENETDDIGLRSASKSAHSVGAPRPQSGYEPNQTPGEHQTENFARAVADRLLKCYQQGLFQQLILSASPEFLGVLRKQLHANVGGIVQLEINKDYTQSDARELAEHMHKHERRE